MSKRGGNTKCTGKKVSQEQSIISKLKDMVKTDNKVYFLIWKFAPQLLLKQCKTFEDLKSTYKCFESDTFTEAFCSNWLIERNMQTASKFLISRTNQLKLIELYNTLYEKALNGDVNAIKTFGEFSSKYFKDDTESEFLAMLQGIKIEDDDNADDEFEMV